MKKRLIWKTLAIGVLWLVAAIFIFPVAAVVGLCWLVYHLYRFCQGLSVVRNARNRRKAAALYRRACALQRKGSAPDPEQFARRVSEELGELGHYPSSSICLKLVSCTQGLYEAEGFAVVPPPPPGEVTDIAAARYRDLLSQLLRKLSHPKGIDLAHEAILRAYADFCKLLPPVACQSPDAPDRDAEKGKPGSQFTVRLIDVLPEVPSAVEALCRPFYSQAIMSVGLFAGLRAQLDRNRHDMSGVLYTPTNDDSPKLVGPTQHEGTAEEIVRGYLRHTPFEEVFFGEIPFQIPEQTRFEHQVIFAGSGHGKSQALQFMIAHDLERVAEGNASIVVIDSQGDMIKNIANLKIFAEGQPLHGKLCMIDPTDIEYPVALNLFAVGMERINQYSPLTRERLMNGILETYDFVIGSLLSAELTQKQSVIFRFIVRLLIHIPGATIQTLRELMGPEGYEKYQVHIDKLQGTARAFFETEFNSKEFADTKRQVVRRLWGILENQTFERMFSHPRNKLDLFKEMNSGKVILINTAKELLKQNGTEIFGRFFIALIAQVAQERAVLPRNARLPTFVYIDEVGDYWDENVSRILEQARKFNVGMVLAAQFIGQASQKLQESFSANTSSKFAGGVSDKDARALSHMMRCTPEFIDGQPKGHFAAHVRNLTSSAVSLRIPFGHMEAMPRMTQSEFERVRAKIREQYAVYWKEMGQEAEMPKSPPVINPDAVDT